MNIKTSCAGMSKRLARRLTGAILGVVLTTTLFTTLFAVPSAYVQAQAGDATPGGYTPGSLNQDWEESDVGQFFEDAGEVLGDLDTLFGGGEGDATSFTQFEGGLRPPSGEGLAQELTATRDARQFILKIINFVLGFLAIIAVAVIIWGGFLYVTSRGEQEQGDEGKKTLQYAIIGIVMIIASFAIVNTLVTFTTSPESELAGAGAQRDLDGTAGDGGGGGGGGGFAIGDSGMRGSAGIGTVGLAQAQNFQLAASEIQSIFRKLVNAYRSYLRIDSILKQVKQLQDPKNEAAARSFVRSIKSALGQVASESAPLSATELTAKRVIDQLLNPVSNLTGDDFAEKFVDESGGESSNAVTPPGNTRPPTGLGTGRGSSTTRLFQNSALIAQTGTSEALDPGINNWHDSPDTDFLKELKKAIEPFDNTVENDFKAEVQKLIDRIDIILVSLGQIGDSSVSTIFNTAVGEESTLDNKGKEVLSLLPAEFTVRRAAEKAQETLGAVILEINPEEPTTARVLLEAGKDLEVLYYLVANIKFVVARITASAVEGNAPFTVQFEAVGSADPAEGSIVGDEGRIQWDLNGDGDFKSGDINCKEEDKTTVSCTYHTPGTYRVALKIDSSNPREVASGQAFLTVNVHTPSSLIDLRLITAGEESSLVGPYSKDTNVPDNDVTHFDILTSEAKAGVTFDASKTTDGSGSQRGIADFSWSFGDGSGIMSGANRTIIKDKTYPDSGSYPLVLTVSDIKGSRDRKIIDIEVTDTVARIFAPTLQGDLGTTFEFDGTRSKSDNGAISAYRWSVVKQTATGSEEVTDVRNAENDTLRYQFTSPGNYEVSLEVEGADGTLKKTSVTVRVLSQKPTASFEVFVPDPSIPATYTFDATKSFDPDKDDKLRYQWKLEEVGGAVGNQFFYSVTAGKEDGPAAEAQLLTVKFNRVGKYKMTLTVDDQHLDTVIRQQDDEIKEFDVTSVVGAKWDDEQVSAVQLDASGQAKVAFTATTDNATDSNCAIDFGDGPVEDCNARNVVMRAEHTYASAGSFDVVLIISAEGKGYTELRRRVAIGAGDKPIAVIEISVDEVPVLDAAALQVDGVYRRSRVTFDASKSINVNGTAQNLDYNWQFGDGEGAAGKKATHEYGTISPEDPGYFNVILTVKNQKSPFQIATATVPVRVKPSKPEITSLSFRRLDNTEVTPLDVLVTAEGVTDRDGRAVEYSFWYFDETEPERKLGLQIVQQNNATLTIQTKGTAGEEHEYLLCVDIRDNENNTSTCLEDDSTGETGLFTPSQLPKITVKNGNNDAPVANFVAKNTQEQVATTFKSGELITFESLSTDSDGEIKEYVWDIEGDGFHNNSPTPEDVIRHEYDALSPKQGYRVKLKAIDNLGAEGYSREIPIYIVSEHPAPTANFSWSVREGTDVQFTSSSTSNIPRGEGDQSLKHEWDFDLEREFKPEGTCGTGEANVNCDQIVDNDVDATSRAPFFTYPQGGPKSVRLTVTDSQGQTAVIPKDISVSGGMGTPSTILKADLVTRPAFALVPAGCDPNNLSTCRKVINLLTPESDIEFTYGGSRGDLVKWVIDEDTFTDSSGNGVTDDDEDHVAAIGGKHSIHFVPRVRKLCTDPKTNETFQCKPDHYTVKLTVYDADGAGNNPSGSCSLGGCDIDEVDIKFDASLLGGSLRSAATGWTPLLVLAAFATLMGIFTYARTYGVIPKKRRRAKRS